MKKALGVWVLMLALAALVAGQSQAAAAGPSGQDSLVVTKKISRADQQAAMALWTREELAAARPFPMPVDHGSPSVEAGGLDGLDEPGLLAGSSPPGKADPDANALARQAYPLDWEADNQSESEALADIEALEPAGASQVYTSYIVNQWSPAQKIYPHRWIGQLSYLTPDGRFFCSATAISGNNIVTAAHCVYDTTRNTWYSKWAFTPAYRNGSAPYGTFRATECSVLNSWVNLTGSFQLNTWARHDVAVCTMGNNSAGKTLNSAVGWAGREWDKSYVRSFFDLGYPLYGYDDKPLSSAGKFLRTCTGESFKHTTDTLGLGCNWGGGISGGPWLVGYAPNRLTARVNSVNSGIFIGVQNIYGARFTSNNIVPLCNARGC